LLEFCKARVLERVLIPSEELAVVGGGELVIGVGGELAIGVGVELGEGDSDLGMGFFMYFPIEIEKQGKNLKKHTEKQGNLM